MISNKILKDEVKSEIFEGGKGELKGFIHCISIYDQNYLFCQNLRRTIPNVPAHLDLWTIFDNNHPKCNCVAALERQMVHSIL